jgi:hypothetical protein
VTLGIHFLEHRRRGLYARVEDLLRALDELEREAVKQGHDPHLVEVYRRGLLEAAARRR